MKQYTVLLLFVALVFMNFSKPMPNKFRKGKDYALFFAVTDYIDPRLKTLNNPINDAKTIAAELKNNYDFQTEVVENPTYEMIEQKLKEYNRNFQTQKFDPNGQLLIFFSGHGAVELRNGYFLPSNANTGDLKRTAFNYKIWRDDIDAIDCKHVLVAIDACYSGSFDPRFSGRPGDFFGTRPGELSEGQRLIAEHEKHKSRIFYTSGESDQPTPDKSDFAKKFLEALYSKGYGDGILTSSEIFSNALEKAAPRPRMGDFGADEAGSSFIFVAAQNSTGINDVQKETDFWQQTKAQNTLYGYKEYVRQFPNGDFTKPAKAAIANFLKQEELNDWANAKAINSIQSYQSFKNKYPNSIYAPTAQERIDDLQPVIRQPITLQPFEPKMVDVNGGTFQMGSGSIDKHTVTLSSFQIGKYEVTQAQWQAVMGNNPSEFKGDNLPIENVNCEDVQDYLKKLNQNTGKKYRLPTEAEWEFAARGGLKSQNYIYSGSNDLNLVAWKYDNLRHKTHPVGQKLANELGIYDMTGNVWEWCSDWFDENYYKNSPSSNPENTFVGCCRVARGGSWQNVPVHSEVSHRYAKSPAEHYNSLGFRVASAPH